MIKFYSSFKQLKDKTNFKQFLIIIFPFFLIIGSAFLNFLLFLISVIFIYDFIKNKEIENKFYRNSWIKIYIIFWIYIVINSFFSSDILASIKNSFFQIRYLFFILFIHQNLDLANFKLFIYSIITCLFFVGIDNNIQYFTGLDIFGFPAEGYIYDVRNYQLDENTEYHIGRLSGPFRDELISGAYLSKLGFISFLYFLTKFSNSFIYNKLIFISCYLFLFQSILITGERTSTLIFLILTFIIFIFYFGLKKGLLALAFFIGIFIIFIQQSDFLKFRVNDTFKILKDYKNSSYGRLTTSAKHVWKEDIFTGVGMKNYRVECLKIEDPKPGHKFQFCSSHPHNTLLELLSETGLVGTIIFILFISKFFLFIFSELKMKKSDLKFYSYSLLLNLLIFLIPILPSGSLFTSWNASFIWLILGINLFLLKLETLKS